jgi:hypothetical protein
MCVTSAIIDQWTNPHNPGFIPWTPQLPSPNLAQEMLTILTKLEDIDRRLKQTECKMEAQAKERFKTKLRRRANRSR